MRSNESPNNLIGHGRLIQEFVRQIEEPTHVLVFTDSDPAGCLKTHRSTPSSKPFHGSQMLRSTALSSGESEFCDLVKGTSAGLGAVLMLKDLGVDISKSTKTDKAVLEVGTDASAGRGKAVRRGVGSIRHIATPTLSVQKLTQEGKVNITKIPRVSNPADLGTKHLDGGSTRRALESCHCYILEGRFCNRVAGRSARNHETAS